MLLEYEFMRNALSAAFLVGMACGIIGTFVVVKKLVSISGGIAHAAFGGIGLGYLLGVNPILSAIPFTVLSALGIGYAGRKTKISNDTQIGILWAVGMSLGIIFISLKSGYAPDLFSYLFGSILTVSSHDLAIMLLLDALIMGTVLIVYKEFVAVSFDEEFVEVSGAPAGLIYMVLLTLISLSIIVLIRVVGVILVIALLSLPASIARKYSHSLKRIMLLATAIAVFFSVAGLLLSYYFNLPSGATIVLLLAAAFFIPIQKKS